MCAFFFFFGTVGFYVKLKYVGNQPNCCFWIVVFALNFQIVQLLHKTLDINFDLLFAITLLDRLKVSCSKVLLWCSAFFEWFIPSPTGICESITADDEDGGKYEQTSSHWKNHEMNEYAQFVV